MVMLFYDLLFCGSSKVCDIVLNYEKLNLFIWKVKSARHTGVDVNSIKKLFVLIFLGKISLF